MYEIIYSLLDSIFGFSPYLKVFTYCYFMPCSSDAVYYLSATALVVMSVIIVFAISLIFLTIREKYALNKYKKAQ